MSQMVRKHSLYVLSNKKKIIFRIYKYIYNSIIKFSALYRYFIIYVMGWIVLPQNGYVETLAPPNVTVFGYSIFKTVIYEVIKMGPTPIKGHLATPVIGNLDTQTTGIALPGGKAWEEAAMCKPRREDSEKIRPGNTFILDF